ncbi:phytoene/squalene synthase family protein [Rubrobacter marinus]|uniref:phytoene/squalene synthase family protein n=1 Tax=Rubrobacter marinus TaxID=2653852 RepID=UPI0014088323|nr:phytoene/squalene synthase family protein [Rubrobacter marinus]
MRLDPAKDGPLAGADLTLAGCYELCRRIHKAHSRTYYFSTSLFPKEVRPHVHALYGFMRYADEIVDNPGATSLEEQLSGLEAFEAETLAAVRGEPVPNPVLRAFASTVNGRGIGTHLISAFMRSMKMDTHVFRYETYEDLQAYTYGSAAVVGLMMCRVVGAEHEEAAPHAEALGVAMQLTNFLRDVGEDWARGRVYLPVEDLKRFGYGEEELGRGVIDGRFVALMRLEMARARELYAFAHEGMKYIPRGRRYPVVVALELYAAILDRIEASGYDVFTRRAETSFPHKLRVAAAVAARDPGEIPARLRPGSAASTPAAR